jgi:hypothetical protein
VGLADDQQVIQTLAPQGADQSFSNRVLPWRSGRDWPVAYPHRPETRQKDLPVTTIIVAHPISRRRCPGKGFRNLLSQSGRRWMTGDLDPEQLPTAMTQDQKREQAVTIGKSMAAIASAWLRRNVFQVCDGGRPPRTKYFDTVDWATSNPSISNSP